MKSYRSGFTNCSGRSILNRERQATLREKPVNEKLQQGDRMPALTLNLIDGGTLTLPEAMSSRYLALLFYRGVW